MSQIPSIRIRSLNVLPMIPNRRYVLYWMTAFRRLEDNFALDHAVNLANRLGRPLVVFEPLRCDYSWASNRFHRFLIDAMITRARHLATTPVTYVPYIEPVAGAGKGLLEALAAKACIVVGDDHPGFFLPRMLASAAQRLDTALEVVDSCGILPLRAADRIYVRAFDFRRFLQRELSQHLNQVPRQYALRSLKANERARLPPQVSKRWPSLLEAFASNRVSALERLPIDHSVPVIAEQGGSPAALRALQRFVNERLPRYDAERNFPSVEVTSGLSGYLHFGHIGSHRVFRALAKHEEWEVSELPSVGRGNSRGFWNMSASSEAFLDQLITWRELGYNMAWQRSDSMTYQAQPLWAQRTLEKHREDTRTYHYTLDQLSAAETHDELWNAAQRQLLVEGRIHNALRMLWGKKVLEWTADPEDAFRILVTLNDRYAIDGRDPNSYSGIGWCMGRYDRAWGPERAIFGTVRYMSSENSRRKWKPSAYMQRWGRASSR